MSKSKTGVSELLVEALHWAGIERAFATSGDRLNPLTEALCKRGDTGWLHVGVSKPRHSPPMSITGSLAVGAGLCGSGNLLLINGLHDGKRSVNPSFIEAVKLGTLHLGNQRDEVWNGSTADGELPGAGDCISGIRAEGEGMGRGERRADALAGELVRAFAPLASAA